METTVESGKYVRIRKDARTDCNGEFARVMSVDEKRQEADVYVADKAKRVCVAWADLCLLN